MLLIRSTQLTAHTCSTQSHTGNTDTIVNANVVLLSRVAHTDRSNHIRNRLAVQLSVLGRELLHICLHCFEFSLGTGSNDFCSNGQVLVDGVLDHIHQVLGACGRSYLELGQALRHQGGEAFEGAGDTHHGRHLDEHLFVGANVDLQETCLVQWTIEKCQ